MTWVDVALWAAFLIGAVAMGMIVARRPAFWIMFGSELFKRLWPHLFKYVTKRMDPETEARWRQCQRRGGKWNHRTKKCE
jgi:hypothetical protein